MKLGFTETDITTSLDLNEQLITHPAATFFVRFEGTPMKEPHIFPGDVLIIDRALKPKSLDLILAVVDGEFIVKRLKELTQQEFHAWGVVTYVIHKTR